MTTEHRKAPRRQIREISRVGGWGNVKYHHLLECGHIEVRARASSAPKLACVVCFKVDKLDHELRNLPVAEEISFEIIDFDAEVGKDEVRISRMTATIAQTFGIPVDAVSIQTAFIGGRLRVRSAHIFLGAHDVERLGEK